MTDTTRAIVIGTLVAGTLDILSAFVFGGMGDIPPGAILRYVASGPLGDGMRSAGGTGAALGLLTHYVLMAIMVTVFVLAARRWPALLSNAVVSGAVYGLVIYGVMYWIVVPQRFGSYPKIDAWGIGNALFSHIICVGIPIALVVKNSLKR